MSDVAARLDAVRDRIERACDRAGRAPASVQLVAVSKTWGATAVRDAFAAGQREFGESYAQELSDKAEQLADLDGLRWRFIGHLQRNKARKVVATGASVDSVDSEKLALQLARDAGPRTLPVLVQVNVAGELQKSGAVIDELPRLVDAVRALPQLALRGLMTVPPAGDLGVARRVFATLRQLAETHRLPELSMGMSDDLEVAIEEGATHVRVGTAIFGPRS